MFVPSKESCHFFARYHNIFCDACSHARLHLEAFKISLCLAWHAHRPAKPNRFQAHVIARETRLIAFSPGSFNPGDAEDE